jgi:hypothetical protein
MRATSRMASRIPHCLALLWVTGRALSPVGTAAASDEATAVERRVKAAYLYKFAGYVDWPASALKPDAPFVIAIVGDEELGAEVERICIDRAIHGHRTVVRREASAASLDGVLIAFIGLSQTEQLGRIRDSHPATPCLLVTEAPGALRQGSIINFVLVADRVRFEISQAAAEARGLTLSSRLLAVASSVIPGVP